MTIIFALLPGCLENEFSSPCADGPYPPAELTDAKYVLEDSGKDENAIRGDIIIIELEENPTTGYSWNLTASPGLSLKSDRYEQTGDEDMVGSGGVHTWTFEVTGEGGQSVEAVYKRPWENITGNETTFTLNLEVVSE